MSAQPSRPLQPVMAGVPVKKFAADDVFDRIQKALKDKDVVERSKAAHTKTIRIEPKIT